MRNGLHRFVSGASVCGVIGIFAAMLFCAALAVDLAELAAHRLMGAL